MLKHHFILPDHLSKLNQPFLFWIVGIYGSASSQSSMVNLPFFDLYKNNEKLINLLYNIDPTLLINLYHINYHQLFDNYWFTAFLETHLTSFNINLFKFTPGPNGSGTTKKPIQEVLTGSNSSRYLNSIISFNFKLADKNGYNLLLLNKLLKGKVLKYNHHYYLILKYSFGQKEIKFILDYLEKFPFKNPKLYVLFFKIRKIYRICQRKENYYHKGILKILRIFFFL